MVKGVFITMNISMKKMLYPVLGCCLLLLAAGAAQAQAVCPSVGSDAWLPAPYCGAEINVTSATGGVATAFSVTLTGNPAYDGIEDTSVGVTNNSGATSEFDDPEQARAVPSALMAMAFARTRGDSYCSTSTTYGYEGPNMTFSLSGGGDTLDHYLYRTAWPTVRVLTSRSKALRAA